MNRISQKISLLFLAPLLFNEMVLDHMWGITTFSRLSNILVILILLYLSISTLLIKVNKSVFLFYILPILIYLLGFYSNLGVSFLSNSSVINQVGLSMPWLGMLSIPYLVYKKDYLRISAGLWSLYTNIMAFFVSLSSIEYLLAIRGLVPLRNINIGGTEFLAGITCIYHGLTSSAAIQAGQVIHYRYYGPFNEPGTAAMLLLPALVYSLINKKYIFSIIFLVAISLTKSLGGYISLILLIPLILIYGFRTSIFKYIIIFLIISTCIFNVGTIKEQFMLKLDQKGLSTDVRIRNVTGATSNILTLIKTYPLGMELEKDTKTLMKNNRLWFGSNFSILSAFYSGGLFSFLGFMGILILTYYFVSIKLLSINRYNHMDTIVMISLVLLFPFNVQRIPITGTILFPFLFAPYIINFLLPRSSN